MPHWYTLLFAYLPAPVVSIRTWHLKYATAHVFPPFFPLKLSPFFFLSLCLPLTPVHLLCLVIPPLHPATSLIPFPLSHSDIRVCFFFPSPRQDAWQGSRWNREQMTNPSLPPQPHTPPLLRRNHCPARGLGFSLHPAAPSPSYLDHIDIQICPSHLISAWRSHLTIEGEDNKGG